MRKRIHVAPPKDESTTPAREPKFAGVWIDHAKAYIVILQGENVTMESVYSNAPSHHRATGGHGRGQPFSHDTVVSERHINNHRELELKRFYRQVISFLTDAEEILLMGPGEAKHECHREFLRHAPLSRRLAAVHTDDRMTERQLSAKVKRFFENRRKNVALTPGTVIAG